MAKKKAETEAAEQANELLTAEEPVTEPAPTVTISKAELDEIRSQIKLLTQQAAAEDRYKSAEQRQAEENEKLLEQVRLANERAMELVEIRLDKGSLRANKNAEVSINGKQYVIPKGVTVKVPRAVAEVLENSERQRAVAYALQEKRAAEAREAEEAGFL